MKGGARRDLRKMHIFMRKTQWVQYGGIIHELPGLKGTKKKKQPENYLHPSILSFFLFRRSDLHTFIDLRRGSRDKRHGFITHSYQ